jgi:ATP-binding protein involved in chromosome partitioning
VTEGNAKGQQAVANTSGSPASGSSEQDQGQRLKASMSRVKHKLIVLSGKGGVGKSTVTANLAIALASEDHAGKVGVLDADITGPSIPKMLGIRSHGLAMGPPGVFPALGPYNMKVISMDYFLASDEMPVIWRGPLKSAAIRQFLGEVVWGDLDFLLVDLPPGTGDEALTVVQNIQDIRGVVIVTIPSEVSQIVVKKAITFTRQLGAPVLGIIENMSGFVCPQCGTETSIFKTGGGRKIAEQLGVQFLGRVPLDARICDDSDQGTPFIVQHPDSPAAKAFMEIVRNIKKQIPQQQSNMK